MVEIFRYPELFGILNVTPDSFSDGGCFNNLSSALEHAKQMVAEGADYIDLGAESTRPGYEPVSVEDEIMRVSSILTALEKENIPVSLDTSKAQVARFGLEHGVQIINDVRGLQGDSQMATTIAEFMTPSFRPKVIIMHWAFGEPEATALTFEEVKRYFDKSIELALKAGLAQDQLVLDVGAGFAKKKSASLEAVRLIPQLKAHYKLPIMVGLSRKRFLTPSWSTDPIDRLIPGLAADLFSVLNGADMVRVHDIRSTKTMFDMWKELAQ